MKNIFDSQLPEGCSFVLNDSILPSEIIALRESVGWSGDSVERWSDAVKQSLLVVGVKGPDETLIGMACLAGNGRHAVMCDLCVRPDHQHKGIGEAIMNRLYEAVDSLGILYVYAELAHTNPFKDKMLRTGFGKQAIVCFGT